MCVCLYYMYVLYIITFMRHSRPSSQMLGPYLVPAAPHACTGYYNLNLIAGQ